MATANRSATSPRSSRSTSSGGTRRVAGKRPTRAAGAQGKSDAKASAYSTRRTAQVGDYAERAVLIPVGAALIARDRLVAGVSDVVSSYSSPTKAQSQLRKFERRGSTARNRLEREARKTRTRVERELRKRRRELDRQRGSFTKSLTSQIEQTQAQVESAVRARVEAGADFANQVQERVLSLV